jgi:hypothetical protein
VVFKGKGEGEGLENERWINGTVKGTDGLTCDKHPRRGQGRLLDLLQYLLPNRGGNWGVEY